MKNLSFHHFKTELFFFLSDKVPKASIVPFFYFSIIVLKLPVCLKLLDLYWKLSSLFLNCSYYQPLHYT